MKKSALSIITLFLVAANVCSQQLFQSPTGAIEQSANDSMEVKYQRPAGVYCRMAWRACPAGGGAMGMCRFNQALVVAPAFTELRFVPVANKENAKFAWYMPADSETGNETISLSEKTDSEGTLHLTNNRMGESNPPLLYASTETLFAQYIYGQECQKGIISSSPDNVGGENIYSLTEADCILGGGTWMYGLDEEGNRMPSFSSHYVSVTNGACTGALQIFEAPLASLHVSGVELIATTEKFSTHLLPEGKTIEISLHYVDESGEIEKPAIASATADNSNETVADWGHFLNVDFTASNDGKAIEVEPRRFAVVVQGWDSSCDITCLFTSANGGTRGAYSLHGEQLETIGSDGNNMPAYNLLIGLRGAYECFENSNTVQKITLPASGGTCITEGKEEAFTIYSTFHSDTWEFVHIPQWLSVTIIKSDSAQGIYSLVPEASPMSFNEAARSDSIVISSSYSGKRLKLPVQQSAINGVETQRSTLPYSARLRNGSLQLAFPSAALHARVFSSNGKYIAGVELKGKASPCRIEGMEKAVYIIRYQERGREIAVKSEM